MIDHIGFAVKDMARAKAFYLAALKPLGVGVIWEVTAEQSGGGVHAGFGKDNKAFFWIAAGAKPKGGTHVAFTARTRADVDAFYRAALADGGRDNGAPGPGPIVMSIITAPSSSIPTTTTSKRCVVGRNEGRGAKPPTIRAWTRRISASRLRSS